MMIVLKFSILIFLHIFASTCDATFFPFRVLQHRNVQTYDELERVTFKYLCPPETIEDIQLMKEFEKHSFAVASDCYLDKEFKDSESKMCKNELEPRYMSSENHCNYKDDDASNDRIKYRIGYLYCGSRENIKKFMEQGIRNEDQIATSTYHVCWDRKTKETIYTKHEIWSYGLFGEERLQKEQAYESIISTQPYFLSDPPFSRLENAYNNQPVTPDRVEPRFMVPQEHMVFAAERKATFHFINTAPLLEKLIPLMDLIDNRIKNFAIQEKKLLTIYTTAFYNSLVGLPRYIREGRNNKFLIPNIWCKVVHHEVDADRHSGVAIIVINTLEFNDNLSNAMCEKPYECNFQEWMDARYTIPQGLEKHAFCCEVSKIIANFYPLNLNFNDILPM